MKFPNSKLQISVNKQIPNSKRSGKLVIGNWLLEIYWSLEIGYWKLRRSQSGQGLLETTISLGIIITGIVSMMTLSLSNQTSSVDAGDRLVAANLAREGIEIARNIRDSNWLPRGVWDQGLESGTDYTAAPLFDSALNTWTLDFTANDINHNYARLWRGSGIYFQSTAVSPPGAALTPYRRLLQMDEICQDKTVVTSGASCNGALNPKIGIRLQSTIQWSAKGQTYSLVAEERLFNWR